MPWRRAWFDALAIARGARLRRRRPRQKKDAAARYAPPPVLAVAEQVVPRQRSRLAQAGQQKRYINRGRGTRVTRYAANILSPDGSIGVARCARRRRSLVHEQRNGEMSC